MRVPTLDAPDVLPSTNAGNDYLNVQASPADFGAQVGQGLDRLGAGVGQISDSLTNIQALNNQARATDAETGYIEKLTSLSRTYRSLSGQAAVDGYDNYQGQVTQARQDMLATLPNGQSQKIFNALAQRHEASALDEGSNYALAQQKQWTADSANASVDVAVNKAAGSGSEQDFGEALGTIHAQAERQGAVLGWSPEQIDDKVQNDTGRAWAARLKAVSNADPIAAMTMLHQNQDQIPGLMRDQLFDLLAPKAKLAFSKIDAASTMPGLATPGGAMPAGGSYAAQLASAENASGDPNASPTTSDAKGRYQFTSATWNGLAAEHPELNLTPVGNGQDGRLDNAQQDRALPVFTAGNSQVLGSAGVRVTDANLRVAHFLGAGGAVSFLKANEADPSQDASAVVGSAAVKANPAIFNQPGVAGTVGGVYDRLTKGFSQDSAASQATVTDPRAHTAEWLANGAQAAEARFPGDPSYADLVDSRIKNQTALVEYAQAQTDRANRNTLLSAALGTPGQPKPTDIDQLLSNDGLKTAYASADPETQRGVLALLEHNAAGNVNQITPDNEALWYQTRGIARNDPVAFSNLDLTKGEYSKLTPEQLHDLSNIQMGVDKRSVSDQLVQQSITALRPMISAAGITFNPGNTAPQPQKDTWNQLTGAIEHSVSDFVANNKKSPTADDIDRIGRNVLMQGFQRGSAGWFSGDKAVMAFQAPPGSFYATVPPDARQGLVSAYQAKHGAAPSDAQIQNYYLYSLQSGQQGARP